MCSIGYLDVPIIAILLNCHVKLNRDCLHYTIKASTHSWGPTVQLRLKVISITQTNHREPSGRVSQFLFHTSHLSRGYKNACIHLSYKRLTIDTIYFLLQTIYRWNKQKCFAKALQSGCELSYCNLILFMSHDS